MPVNKTLRSLLLVLGLALLGPALLAAAPERGPLRRAWKAAPEDPSNARVIVKYRAGSRLMQALAVGRAAPLPQHANALAKRLSLPLSDGRVLGRHTQGLRGVGLSSSQLAARLAAQPDVEWAVVDRRRRWSYVPGDPYFAAGQTGELPAVGQWYLRAPDATIVSAVNAVGAWDLTRGSSALTVAVLDTGVRFDHPDLANKLYPGYDFIKDIPTAGDGNGRDANASDPGDWTNDDECSPGEPASSSSWHGTQVSGLVAAASDNGIGMAGTAGRVMVLPVRVLGRCGGWDEDIIAGMRWAAGLSTSPVLNTHPAKVLNLSLGGGGTCEQSYQDLISELTAAKVTVVAAAGNDAGLAVGAPANCPGVIAVAGLRHNGTKAGYSSLGPEVVVAAPAGNCVNTHGACLYPLLTTINSGITTPGANTYSDAWNASLGTSFSTPIVAGAVALMLSIDPTLTPGAIQALLQSTARPFPTTGDDPGLPTCRAPTQQEQDYCYCTDRTCGAGMLDAAAAVAAVKAGGASAISDADRVFNYLESRYPEYVAPAGAESAVRSGYYFRYYASTKAYVGMLNGNVYYLVPAINGQINLLGTLKDWLASAAAAGY